MGYSEHSKPSTSASVNFMQEVPNSHYWTDLNQIIANYNAENLTKDYLVTGLLNTLKNGYNIKSTFKNYGKIIIANTEIFTSVENMIAYISGISALDKITDNFFIIISDTILTGLNLTNGKKIGRREIYQNIDGEMNYQDKTWVARRTANGTPDEEKPVAEWINYIEHHLNKAKDRVYYLDTEGVTHELRKVAALAVRAMEIHGCPERVAVLDHNPDESSYNGTINKPLTNTLL
jgi:hypothetical protein